MYYLTTLPTRQTEERCYYNFMETIEALPSGNPLGYYDSRIYPQLSFDALVEHTKNIAEYYADYDQSEANMAQCTDEERMVMESLLRWVDVFLPNQEGFPRKQRHNSLARFSIATAYKAIEFQHTDVDFDDLRQDARIKTIQTLRRHDPEAYQLPLQLIGRGIAGSIEQTVANGLRQGFSYRRIVRSKNSNDTDLTSITLLQRSATSSRTEQGFSDEIQALREHPDYKIVETLQWGEETEFDDGISQRAMMPLTDKASTGIEISEVEENVSFSQTIDLIDEYIGLSMRDKRILHMRFRDALTLDEIGSYLGLTRERIRQLIEQNIARIHNAPSLMNELDTLR